MNGESGSAGMLAGNRAGGAAGAEAASGSAAAVSAGSSAGSAGQARGGAGSSRGVAGTGQGGSATATGSTSSPADSRPSGVNSAGSTGAAEPVAGIQGAAPQGVAGNAASLGGNPGSGGGARPAAPQQGAGAVNPEQGVAIFTGAETCQGQPTCNAFPADSRLDIADARNVIAGQDGSVSFWLEPQWNAQDGSSATLMNLGSGDAQQNRFEIFKDGQTLHLAFADNSGAPIDINTAIDGWQPGDQHLVTATWGQGQTSFYVDGKLVGQQPYSGQLDVPNNTPLSIGSGYPDAQTAPGLFLDTHFYKRTLAPGEVAGQAAAPPGQGVRAR